MTDKDVIKGLECMTGKLATEHMREFHKTGKNPCKYCVYEYIRKSGTICMELVAADAAKLLQDHGCKDEEIISALECIGCKRHNRPANCYEKYREEECSHCKYYVKNRMCFSMKACEDALDILNDEVKDNV